MGFQGSKCEWAPTLGVPSLPSCSFCGDEDWGLRRPAEQPKTIFPANQSLERIFLIEGPYSPDTGAGVEERP